MIHPSTTVAAGRLGLGVVATARIRAGEITWMLDPLDVYVSDLVKEALPPGPAAAVDKFAFLLPGGHWVVCWDHAKYLNHCCEPNCAMTVAGCEVAIRDIEPGEELTVDYGPFLGEGEGFACACASPGCRGRVEPGVGIPRLHNQLTSADVPLVDLGPLERLVGHLSRAALARRVKALCAEKNQALREANSLAELASRVPCRKCDGRLDPEPRPERYCEFEGGSCNCCYECECQTDPNPGGD